MILAAAEDLGDVGDDLLVAGDQGIGGSAYGALVSAAADGGLHGLALTAPDDGAGLEHHGIGREIGDHEARFEGSHLAALIFAHQELHAVLAGLEGEAGIVMEVAVGPVFRRRWRRSLTWMKSRTLPTTFLRSSMDLADEIELRFAAALFSRESDHRAGNLHRDRNEVRGGRDAEVIDFEGQRQIGLRVGGERRPGAAVPYPAPLNLPQTLSA